MCNFLTLFCCDPLDMYNSLFSAGINRPFSLPLFISPWSLKQQKSKKLGSMHLSRSLSERRDSALVQSMCLSVSYYDFEYHLVKICRSGQLLFTNCQAWVTLASTLFIYLFFTHGRRERMLRAELNYRNKPGICPISSANVVLKLRCISAELQCYLTFHCQSKPDYQNAATQSYLIDKRWEYLHTSNQKLLE